MNNALRYSALVLILLWAINPQAEEHQEQRAARIIKDTALLATPERSATAVTTLNKDRLVLVNHRQRGWYQVTTDDKKLGWVSILAVSFSLKEEQSNRFKNLFEGVEKLRQSSEGGTSSVSTGVRGLDENDIVNAKLDKNGLKTMHGYTATGNDAKRYASQAQLTAKKVGFPERSNTSSDDEPHSVETSPDNPFGE